MTVRINTARFSGAVQEAFEVSIPFLPPFTLTPDLSGTFRCEVMRLAVARRRRRARRDRRHRGPHASSRSAA